MRRNTTMLGGLVFVALISSCASQPLPPPKLEPAPEAIRLHVKSDPELNLYNRTPHSLVLCVYQLNSPNGLNQRAEDKEGIYKLRQCGLFDGTVTRTKRLVVQPNQDINMALDRAEGSKYVAVVTGYRVVEKERVIRLYEIPVVEETQGLIRRTKILKLAPLNIELKLGAEQIESQ